MLQIRERLAQALVAAAERLAEAAQHLLLPEFVLEALAGPVELARAVRVGPLARPGLAR